MQARHIISRPEILRCHPGAHVSHRQSRPLRCLSLPLMSPFQRLSSRTEKTMLNPSWQQQSATFNDGSAAASDTPAKPQRSAATDGQEDSHQIVTSLGLLGGSLRTTSPGNYQIMLLTSKALLSGMCTEKSLDTKTKCNKPLRIPRNYSHLNSPTLWPTGFGHHRDWPRDRCVPLKKRGLLNPPAIPKEAKQNSIPLRI